MDSDKLLREIYNGSMPASTAIHHLCEIVADLAGVDLTQLAAEPSDPKAGVGQTTNLPDSEGDNDVSAEHTEDTED